MATSNGWIWYGLPGHFCGGMDCRFHMATKVGKHLISTVGDYYPMSATERQEIGHKRFYETMVFRAGKLCKADGCLCGMPTIDGHEIDFMPYNTAKDAQAGHLAMCKKYEGKA